MFAYCGNNPVQNLDSGGMFFFTALGALTGFIGSAVTTALVNIVTGSEDDIFMAGVNGAIGGAVAGAGVDAALLVIGSFGTALPVIALAGGIAFVTGGVGNACTTYLASDGKATEQEMTISFILGGVFNSISLGLSTSAISNNVSGICIAGTNEFSSNLSAGLAIATSTSIATEIGTLKYPRTGTARANRMKQCNKLITDISLSY